MRRKLCICFVLSVVATFVFSFNVSEAQMIKINDFSKEEKMEPFTVTVVLERVYLDGEQSQEVFEETIYSMEKFWEKYAQWDLVDMEERKVVFHKKIDDISPLLKANGYFGVTEDGILSIFNGKPEESNVIQSFFQIDVGKLESAKWEQLKAGIPVKNKNHYEKVLSTFKHYTKEKEAN